MKKIGIVFDDYKEEKFSTALRAAGYVFTCQPSLPGCRAIFILVTPEEFADKVLEITKICRSLQINFHLPKN